jgi:hypothetical protein
MIYKRKKKKNWNLFTVWNLFSIQKSINKLLKFISILLISMILTNHNIKIIKKYLTV